MRDYRVHLKDMLAAMDSIEAFVVGMGLEALRIHQASNSPGEEWRSYSPCLEHV